MRYPSATRGSAMKITAFISGAVAIVLAVTAAAQAPKVLRTPWGDPDISGLFTTDDELGVPFERAPQFGDRQFLTDEEYRQRLTQAVRQDEADREEFVAPRAAQGNGPV